MGGRPGGGKSERVGANGLMEGEGCLAAGLLGGGLQSGRAGGEVEWEGRGFSSGVCLVLAAGWEGGGRGDELIVVVHVPCVELIGT